MAVVWTVLLLVVYGILVKRDPDSFCRRHMLLLLNITWMGSFYMLMLKLLQGAHAFVGKGPNTGSEKNKIVEIGSDPQNLYQHII